MNNTQHLASLNNQKSSLFITFLNRVKKELGYDVIITQSYRSIALQNRLHKENIKNSVGGYSAHNYGFAIDVNFIKDNIQLKKATPCKEWIDSGIIKIALECGLRWGGYFKGYEDNVHFDCINTTCTSRWFNYLKKTYPDNFEEIETNKINWKF